MAFLEQCSSCVLDEKLSLQNLKSGHNRSAEDGVPIKLSGRLNKKGEPDTPFLVWIFWWQWSKQPSIIDWQSSRQVKDTVLSVCVCSSLPQQKRHPQPSTELLIATPGTKEIWPTRLLQVTLLGTSERSGFQLVLKAGFQLQANNPRRSIAVSKHASPIQPRALSFL